MQCKEKKASGKCNVYDYYVEFDRQIILMWLSQRNTTIAT